MKIKCNSEDGELINILSDKYNIPPFVGAIFSRRGIAEEDIKYYMESDVLYEHNPFLVDDVYSAVERINDALPSEYDKNGEKIFIFGDKDTDGITSSAIMYKTLKKLGAKDVVVRLPQGDEGYGLDGQIVDEIIKSGSTLCITVDNGVSAIDEIKTLEKNGVDVIVLDHHLPGDKLPPSVAIFDPKIPGNGYPFDGLSGSEVTAKLSWALLFSHTPLMNSRYILLHTLQGNNTIKVEAIKLENLIVTDTLFEEFLVSDIGSEKERMLSFLSTGEPVIVLDRKEELPSLKKIFGSGVEFSLIDFRETLEKAIPRAKGKGLFELSKISRGVKYLKGESEIMTLLSLFQSVMIHSQRDLGDGFNECRVLSSIGAIADLMPLKDENRIIVKKGLEILSKTPPKTLLPLLNRQDLLNTPLEVTNIAFKIAPVLNASGRLGKAEKSFSLLISDDDEEIALLTEELLQMNKERKESEEEAMKSVSKKAESSYLVNEKKYILFSDDTIPKNLTGSIANKILSTYEAPVIVLSDREDEVTGSMRTREGINAKEFLSSLSYLLLDYGGHSRAAGFRMDKKNEEEFFSSVSSLFVTLSSKNREEEIEVDAILDEVSIVESAWKSLRYFSPFGQESEDLRFYIENAKVMEVKRLSGDGKYMKALIKFGVFSWSAIWWDVEESKEIKEGDCVNLVFTPEYNYWRGQKKEQMKILEIEKIL